VHKFGGVSIEDTLRKLATVKAITTTYEFVEGSGWSKAVAADLDQVPAVENVQ
jgi:hypothetical protein